MPVWNEELQQWGFHYYEEYTPCEWLGLNRKEFGMKTYEIPEQMAKRLNNDYIYHSPKDDQAERYQILRNKCRDLAFTIATFTPPSREQSVALTALDQVMMAANSAIARNE